MTTARPLTHRQILVVFMGLATGMLLAALDQTIVATALPVIVGDLGGLTHLSWVVTAYLLTSTVTTPLYGKIGDLYGRKRIFQAAIVVFLAGSALSGLSRGMGELIAFRAVQGAGAGGLMALAMAIIGDVVSPRERGRYQGYLGAVFALSSVMGPLLGGFLTDHASWRWIFYINLPLGAVALFVTATVLDLPYERVQHRLDVTGALLLVAGVSSLLLVTAWGGTEYAWGSAPIVGLACAGAVLVGVFLWWERRVPEPVLPLSLFRNSIFSVSGAASFILGLAMFGAIVFLPLFLQVVTRASATNSGLLLAPLMLGVISASVASGRVITRTGRYRIFPLAGTILLTLGIYLLSTMDRSTTMATAFAFMVVVGVGIGLCMQVLILAVQNAVSFRELGTATSGVTFFRSLGGAFGVSVFGAILNDRLSHHLALLLPGGVRLDPRLLQESPDRLRELPPLVQGALVEAFARSIHVVFLWAIPMAAAAFLIVWFLKELPLRDWAHMGAAVEGAATPPAAPSEPDDWILAELDGGRRRRAEFLRSASSAGMSVAAVDRALRRLVADGLVERPERGVYVRRNGERARTTGQTSGRSRRRRGVRR